MDKYSYIVPMSSQNTSITAYCVACSLQKLSRIKRWRSYFSPELLKLNDALVDRGCDRLMKKLMRALPPALFIRLMDFFFIPGMAYHFLFRKRLIEESVEQAIAAGVTQIIVMGAGLDTLALRMAVKYSYIQFIELDLPATQKAKQAIVAHAIDQIPANCDFHPVDLATTSLKDALASAQKFSATASSMVILEGVLMYLKEPEVAQLFGAMHTFFLGPLTVIFGAIVRPDNEAGFLVRLINRLLARNSEATCWFCPSDKIAEFMHKLGFQIVNTSMYKQLQRQYLQENEIHYVPEEDENYYIAAKLVHGHLNVIESKT